MTNAPPASLTELKRAAARATYWILGLAAFYFVAAVFVARYFSLLPLIAYVAGAVGGLYVALFIWARSMPYHASVAALVLHTLLTVVPTVRSGDINIGQLALSLAFAYGLFKSCQTGKRWHDALKEPSFE